jgi:hypothetical protein
MEKGTKIALALAGAATVTAAVVYWPKKASAAQGPGGGPPSGGGGGSGGGPAPVTKDSGADLIAACADGTKEGTSDGNKDGATLTSKMPSPRLSYSTNTVVQAKFEECYQNAYSKAFEVTAAVVKSKGTSAYSGPKPEETTAAYQSGKDAGYAQGQADADASRSFVIDFSRVPAGFRTQPGTLALAKPWQDGYNYGYSDGFASHSGLSKSKTEYGSDTSDTTDTTDSTTGVGGVVSVGGRRVPVASARAGAISPVLSARITRALATYAPAVVRTLMNDCYNWGYRRGKSDAQLGRSYDSAIVGHSDIARASMSANDRDECARQILRGYDAGYKSTYAKLTPGDPLILKIAGNTDRVPGGASMGQTMAHPAPARPTSSAMALPSSSAMALPGQSQDNPHGLLIAIRKPMEVVTSVAKLPVNVAHGLFSRMRDVGQHIYTRGVVGGAFSSHGYYK